MISEYTFRLATTDDISKIVEFTISEAKESQGVRLILIALREVCQQRFLNHQSHVIGCWKILKIILLLMFQLSRNGVIFMVVTIGGFKVFILFQNKEGEGFLIT